MVMLHPLQINERDILVQAKTRQTGIIQCRLLVGKEGGDDSSGIPNI
jgi:hypothetical protein